MLSFFQQQISWFLSLSFNFLLYITFPYDLHSNRKSEIFKWSLVSLFTLLKIWPIILDKLWIIDNKPEKQIILDVGLLLQADSKLH